MKNKNITKILITLSLFIFVFGMGFKIGEYKTLLNTSSQSGNKNIDFNLFWQTWDRLEEKYVDQKKIDPAKMFYGAIKGMVASVGDPYTFFLTPEENKDAKDDLGGKFTGIGAQLGLKDNQIIIIAPLKDSPALKAGIKAGYIKINQFGENTNYEWDKAINFILENNLKGLILDVRDNPGGFLESSVYIASEFLQKGQIVVKQESTQGLNKDYKSTRNGNLQNEKIVILINEGSASASEILAGALRDYKVATLVGAKTFGKGSVQEALDLKKGAGLHVTVAKWILPNNEWINGKGINPDVSVKNEVEKGIEILLK